MKKRVERSYEDPTTVITTYEGQHNHPVPTSLRGNAAAMFTPSNLLSTPTPFSYGSNFPQDLLLHMHHHNTFNITQPTTHTTNNVAGSVYSHNNINNSFLQQYQQQLPLDQYGLLQDIVPSMFLNRTNHN